MNDLFKPGFGAPAFLAGHSGVEATVSVDFGGFLAEGGLGSGFAPGLPPSFGAAPAFRGLAPSFGSPAITISVGSPVGARNDVVLCVRSPGSACSCGKS